MAPVEAEGNPIRREALDALEAAREDGHRAGLVVMAAGLGKTPLGAFDATRPGVPAALFVAHRAEMLRGGRDVFRRVPPDADVGSFDGTQEGPDARVLFVSIQTPARHLDASDPSDFATTSSSTSPTALRRRLVVRSC